MKSIISNLIVDVAQWIHQDWLSNPTRCILEVIAWIMSISCAVIMMITVPHPPFLLLYPLFITQCAIFAWAAWTRKSLGMLANYVLLVMIDVIALSRMLLL